jgi:uncharacterized protein YyaL (SSP411 family)
VAVVGAPDDPARSSLERVARSSSSPGVVVVVGRPSDASVAGDEPDTVPLLAGRGLVDGRAAAYVCRGMVCDRPVTDPEDLARLLRT